MTVSKILGPESETVWWRLKLQKNLLEKEHNKNGSIDFRNNLESRITENSFKSGKNVPDKVVTLGHLLLGQWQQAYLWSSRSKRQHGWVYPHWFWFRATRCCWHLLPRDLVHLVKTISGKAHARVNLLSCKQSWGNDGAK